MKISKQDRAENKKKIIQAAVRVISDKGFYSSSLREIAKNAAMPEPTIYKYFSSKEGILYAYFDHAVEELIVRLKKIDGFEEYTFHEQFQALLDSMLDIMEPDRAFVKTAYQSVFMTNWLAAANTAQASRERFYEIIDDLIEAAVEVGEFEEPPFRELVVEMLWEYTIAVTYYWLNDVSPKYENTTQMIDKSLGITVALLKSSIMGKSYDFIKFLIREHVLSKINKRPGKSGSAKTAFAARKTKRKLLEASDDRDESEGE